MISNSRPNLTSAILASLASLLLLTWLLLSIISFKTAEKDLLEAKRSHGAMALSLLVSAIPEQFNRAAIERAVNALESDRDYAGLLIVDIAGTPLYSHRDDKGTDAGLMETIRDSVPRSVMSHGERRLVVYTPLLRDGRNNGAARLSFSLGSEYARLARSRSLFIGYFVLDFILLLSLGAFILRRIIVNPLDRLLAATERIIAGDYSHPVNVHGMAEIAGLAESFNSMQHTLKVRRDQVEQYVASLEEANRALQEARQETIRSEKMASVGLLAAGMAHEIGTPLAAIIGYNGVLADELAHDSEKSDYIRRIAMEAARIDRLVRDLLDYARPGRGDSEIIDLEKLFSDLTGMLEGQGVLKRLRVTCLIEEDLPELFLDRHKLMQVLVNLLINARDAMPDGGELSLAAHGDEAGVIIEVADTGGGIPAENLEKIFEPFFTTKQPGRGTGLGLAISARLVESFGGRIEVESVVGRGATFRVRLPTIMSEK